ncbi:MAG: UDP-N-acetylmuramate dehydrogenase [Gemmataceae bacterium]
MARLEEFPEIVKYNEPLAPYAYLKVGGPAEMLVQPRSRAELVAVVRRCLDEKLPLRVLGGGCNILVRDEGVAGVVLRLCEPAFTQVSCEGTRLRAGAGAALSAVISAAAQHGLAGLETMVGIPGTLGGAVRCNAGDRAGDIGQFIRRVEVLDHEGHEHVREREELQFASGASNLDDPVLVQVDLALELDNADSIVKRMRKAWIHRKAAQPLSFQAAARVFRDPRGLHAAALIEQANLGQTKVGGAQLSERDASCIVVHPGASARDVLRLIDLVRSRVREQFDVELELALSVW